MNRTLYLFFIFSIMCCFYTTAQTDSINWLEEVLLTDVKLKKNSQGQVVKKLNDSVLQQSEPLLTSVLKFNSPFFFRENGYGMVSSASVRGTGAAQTAVVWNGININSQFTGQTDFNSINSRNFDKIYLKPGGGSVVYGSGAIGGTIHLDTDFNFKQRSSSEVKVGFGSFETYETSFTGNYATKNNNLKIGVTRLSSKNDYRYSDTDERNTNGDFYNTALNASIAHWISSNDLIKFHSYYYQGARGFSGTLNLTSNSKFENFDSRNLLELKSFRGDFTSDLKLVWLNERYKYYENRDADNYDFGEAATGILKYDIAYDFSGKEKLNLIADYSKIDGKGTGIENGSRDIGGISLLWTQKWKNLDYQLSLRQEITADYTSPLLYSMGSSYKVSDFYNLRLSASRNFRIPTFNDLYWTNGGNPDLQPETSLQAEIGNDFNYGNFELNLTGYYIDIQNLIRWIPDASGLWRPVNTAESYNYGLEVFANYKKDLYENPLHLSASYGYTRAVDKETGNILIYTPQHKITFSGNYEFKGLNIFFQSLFNGSIYTSSDNLYELDSYKLVNLGLEYKLPVNPEIGLSLKMDNLFNEYYQSLPSRIMPGRAIKSTLTIKF